MITVRNITKIYKTAIKNQNFKGFIQYLFNRQYKKTLAVKNISFNIHQHELVGFIGPNGAGKTTTIKMLSGLLYPTSGEIEVEGFKPQERKKGFLKMISFLMGQKNQLFWELPAIDTFIANKEIYEVKENRFRKQLNLLVELLNVSKLLDQPVKTLSLGERMKMELIASLIYEPKILFLDEPTIGLDIISQKAILSFIKEYNKIKGATVILTSHYLKDVVSLANRLIMINKGEIIYDGNVDTIQRKYSKEKVVKLILRSPDNKKFVEKVFNKIEYNYPVVKFKVPKNKIIETLTKLQEIEFEDISIEDISIEEIISQLWQEKE